MEAIKPGCTHDQWADPFQQTEILKGTNASAVGQTPLSRSYAHSFSVADNRDHPTQVANQSTKAGRSATVSLLPSPSADIQSTEASSLEESSVEIHVRQPTPPPRSEISLRSEPYDPYVSADEVLPPPENRDSMWRNSKTMFDHPPIESDGHDAEANKESIYLTLLPPEEPSVSAPQSPTHHRHHHISTVDTKSSSEIVAELEKQFTTLEIDLLVKMLEKISTKTKAIAKSKERRKSADDSVNMDRHKTDQVTKVKPCGADVEEEPGSDGLYSRLADLVLNLDELEPATEQDVPCTPEIDEKSDTAVIETDHPSKTTSSSSESSVTVPVYSPRVPSRSNPQHGSLKEGTFSRKNAVRQRKGAHAKPKEAVTHLSELN